MEFLDLIKSRYSVRAYKNEPVEKEKLEKILEAARFAPTAVNYQPFRLIVIQTKDREDELKQIYQAEWFSQAPLIICVCTEAQNAWVRKDGKNFVDVDATIVMDHIILAATSLGLGTCWIGAFDVDAARKFLSVPANVEPLVFTPLGYPADMISEKKRKPLSELVKYEKW
ncbi:nitroreductase family protein [Methanobacterium sp. ACI-7]|uniref:nitroreductase family protein n=1 Tax=unclassified Methanobacterium TaxID=2627676 RepID=UPI0039C1E501